LALSFCHPAIPCRWKTVVSVVSFLTLCAIVVYLCHSYASTWPPVSHYKLPLQHTSATSTCCSDMFRLMDAYGVTSGDVSSAFYCNGDTLQPM
jgi:hypothetical protein